MIEKHLSGTPIHYWIKEKKSAESILFIHAAFADHTSFDEQIKFFANEYQVITLDLIGHGKSIKTHKGDSITKTADYIFKLLENEAINKIHLVGISIGAIIIQDFANKFPDKVASLCCIGGYYINNFDPKLQKENSGEQVKMMLKAIISIKWFAKSNKLISAVTPEAQEKFYQMNIRFKKRSFIYLAQLTKLVNKFNTTNRNYPVMIGCGIYDNPVAIKVANMWHESEPKSKLIVFENAGHLVNMDTPQEFNKKLFAFIKGDN
ncbi:alpha/beta fold hydrolase [Anaerobacillus isosaccharinicus]|uniref:Alpha/beta hydrolase n=1 Tax=Anaerobacillus isosaccharinicus TaxID=1532552 RepID=A0A1S2LET9_9BACI|nr:alpha/beta hydrolase [Anaerobacillus isosaccharinicus]MBA5586280.1 alpha/beta hydrolase [Anaerobacillus isosaccharinicus]QOY35469.1 alpha/beta hydrolase [Anaerobacillus isosaccharinicus]